MTKLNGSMKRGIIIGLSTVLGAGTLAGTAGLITRVWGNTSEIKEVKTVQQVIREDVGVIKEDVKTLLTRK